MPVLIHACAQGDIGQYLERSYMCYLLVRFICYSMQVSFMHIARPSSNKVELGADKQ